MSWIPVESNGGQYVKWSDVAEGTVFEGTWRGFEQGKFENQLARLEMADGAKLLPAFAALERQLQRVRVDAAVRIQYEGQHATKDGKRRFHACTVLVKDPTDVLPVPAEEQGSDGVPF